MAGNRGEEEGAGIEGDGTRQLFLWNDLGDNGIQGGSGKCADDTGTKDNNVSEPLYPMVPEQAGEWSERKGQETRYADEVEDGRAQEQSALVAFVEDMTGIQGEAKGG